MSAASDNSCGESTGESGILRCAQVSPLAVPVMLEIGRESVPGEASEVLLRETVEELIAEALSGHAARKA